MKPSLMHNKAYALFSLAPATIHQRIEIHNMNNNTRESIKNEPNNEPFWRVVSAENCAIFFLEAWKSKCDITFHLFTLSVSLLIEPNEDLHYQKDSPLFLENEKKMRFPIPSRKTMPSQKTHSKFFLFFSSTKIIYSC